MARRIRQFHPRMPEPYWYAIEQFVRDAVTDAQPATCYAVMNLLVTVSQHTLWCWQTAGIPVTRREVFDRWTIEQYIARGCPTLTPASRGNRRSQLFRVSEVLLGHEARTPRVTPLAPADPTRPYTPAELTRLCVWANGQTTEAKRKNANLLLALGAGAGLSTEDIARLRAADITTDVDGMLVHVTGRRARQVPVLSEWETHLTAAIDGLDPDRFAFRPGRTTISPNFVTNFVTACTPHNPRLSCQALRATWIVQHLAAGTPVVPLMAAAGVESLEALTRYVRFIPALDAATNRRTLRSPRRS